MYSSDSGAGKAYEDLLKRDDITAVIIALPIVDQPEYIEAALAAGKHVLAEKPIAKDVARGKQLIEYYNNLTTGNGVTFAIAENFRFNPSFAYAGEQAKKLGKVTHFSVRVMYKIKPDNLWLTTKWRQNPQFQGGFVFDAGVHWAAATRLLLAEGDNRPETVHAFTNQTQKYLVPVDSINAIIRTRSGAAGVFQGSAGTLVDSFEWDFGFERGTVKLEGGKFDQAKGKAVGESVTVKPQDGEAIVKDFDRTSGVSEEVAAWAQSLVEGKPNPLLAPEQALADVEFLEKIFTSGDNNGAPQTFELA